MKYKLQPYSIHELGHRENQEDSMFPDYQRSKPEDRLFILCDGMGGHEKGEVASATVCETMSKTILSRWNPDEPLSDDLLKQAISDAYDALDEKDNGSEKKMGTTMTFVCFHADGVTVAHIGDSRIYQFRPAANKESARIVFRTQDHSLVNDLIKIGEITEEEAKTHPQKNVITRAMQPCQECRAKADIVHLTDIQPGDYFYMCSDGMLEQTSDDNLLFIITMPKKSDKEKVEMLRSVTEDNKDNHTAHFIYINNVEDEPVSSQIQKPMSFENTTRGSQQDTVQQGTWVTLEYEKAKKTSLLPLILGIIAVIAIVVCAYLFYGNLETEDKNESIEIDVPKHNDYSKVNPAIDEHQTKLAGQQSITTPTDTPSGNNKTENRNDAMVGNKSSENIKPNTVNKYTNFAGKTSAQAQNSDSKTPKKTISTN